MISKGAQKAGDKDFLFQKYPVCPRYKGSHGKRSKRKKKKITALTLNVSEQSAR